MFVLLLKYHALQLFVDLLSNHQLTKLNILVEFCCSLCAFPVPLAQPLLLFHYPSHGHIRARAKQRHWLESQNVLTADLSFWWFRSCTITCYLDVLCFWGKTCGNFSTCMDRPLLWYDTWWNCNLPTRFLKKHMVDSASERVFQCYGIMPNGTEICPKKFWTEETCCKFSK